MNPRAIYTYNDAAGKPLRRKLRFGNGPGKFFTWESLDDSGCWMRGAQGKAHETLFHLDRIAATRRALVLVVESEKSAIALTEAAEPYRLIAVTSGGAGSWARHHSDQLRAHDCRQVYAFADHDEPGADYVWTVAACSLAVGISVRIIPLPLYAEHDDIFDFLDRGGTVEQILNRARRIPWLKAGDIPPRKPEPPKSSPPTDWKYDVRLSGLYREILHLPPDATGEQMTTCVFHVESRPSLSVNLSKGVFHCFGCQAKGGTAQFYMLWAKQHGRIVLKTEALRRLHARYSYKRKEVSLL